jgi:hypothetical protein
MKKPSPRENREWVPKAIMRADHIERGLCRDCCEPAEPGKHSCTRHLRFAVQRMTRWRIYRGMQRA